MSILWGENTQRSQQWGYQKVQTGVKVYPWFTLSPMQYKIYVQVWNI